MNFTHVEFPCTVDLNTFKAYFNLSTTKLPKVHGKSLQPNSGDTVELNANQPKALRHLALDTIAENWSENPIFKEIPRHEDRNYILSNLDVNLSLKTLSSHIRDDFFWRKCYQHRWKTTATMTTATTTNAGQQAPEPPSPSPPANAKPWINIYMERHLQEFIENVETCGYDLESVQATLDICAAYINQLEINCLKAAMDGRNDHIPLDFILSNLPELHTLRLAYCTKTVGTNFFLGCNMLSQNDILLLARGLSRSHELVNFCIHSTKLEPYQLRFFARSLDKGCHNLTTLALVHCAVGDEGIRQCLESCTRETFATLKCLDLTNNKITPEGAYLLSRTFRGLSLERLVLRLNPIQSDGAAAVFSMLHFLPMKYIDISGCSIREDITKLFMQLIIQNRTILSVDVSNNELGEEFGKHLYKIVGFNKVLQNMDLRNTGLSMEMRNKFKNILRQNIIKTKTKW